MAETRPQHQAQYRGWLYKWTNYLRGYQKRWFVLQNGLLSYYRNQAEMAHTCRGTINLANAFIHTEDSNTIVISNSGSSTYYLKATSEVERQKWVTALELAKAEAVKMQDTESDEEDQPQPDKNELQNTVKLLGSKLEDMTTCNDLIAKHGSALQRALSELESMEILTNTEHGSKAKVINERATMFRITSNAMINERERSRHGKRRKLRCFGRLSKKPALVSEADMELVEAFVVVLHDRTTTTYVIKESMIVSEQRQYDTIPPALLNHTKTSCISRW
ncbi:oxysterol-binding protein 1 [Mytilus galloprovincialis]|uniref:Oxysterol-binding protein 1 n=1 Tax=Mytilus galloprovincialis TaxID=29158 RepID=A0A8B6BTZ1_MYTGA|nr:oxysterol-binding protein 1 [Mytilus galloprovincialis]